jgi:D-psicose/D-tagatose/L-ribulose 3-epimerase
MKSRRELLFSGLVTGAVAGLSSRLQAAAANFRYSICNEVFEKRDFRESCKLARSMGYTGLEIAPFTLGENVTDISPARRKELRDIITGEGLTFSGMHWLLVTPKWLHVTTPDNALREKSWAYFRQLIDFCGDLRAGSEPPIAMVLGSPKQRGTTDGSSVADAKKRLAEGLAMVAPQAASRKAVIALEALDHSQTDVVNTISECAEIVKAIDNPGLATMFDFHNTPDEKESPDALVRRYFSIIRHVHINEMDGRHPGTGKSDYLPLFRTLYELKYKGWISLEVFDFKLGAERIGKEAMEYMKSVEAKVL